MGLPAPDTATILFLGEISAVSDIRQQRSRAEGIWKNSVETWNRNAGCTRFDEKKAQLLRTVSSYRALPGVERDMLKALETRKRDLQLQKHLEAHKISRARIDGIGDGRKMILRSFGIETAWDIKPNVVKAVPGFGPVLTDKLTARGDAPSRGALALIPMPLRTQRTSLKSAPRSQCAEARWRRSSSRVSESWRP